MKQSKSRRLVSFIALLTAASFYVGCGSSSDSSSNTSIYGGTKTAAGTWLSTVAITDSALGVFCTGTAITPTLVVTAAHCAEAIEDIRRVAVYVGDGKNGGAFLGKYQVSKFKANPKYRTSVDGSNDISYLVLSQALPLTAAQLVPVVKNTSEYADIIKVGTNARIMGFGMREGDKIGEKYQVDSPILEVTSNELVIGGRGKDSCQGDSGGPAFAQNAQGEWRLVGVVSRGGDCGQGGLYGILSKSICWVQQDSGIDVGLDAGTCATATKAN